MIDDTPRFPDDDLRVNYGTKAPGSANPMPAEVRAAYERRILASVEAQAQGARLAARLFVGDTPSRGQSVSSVRHG